MLLLRTRWLAVALTFALGAGVALGQGLDGLVADLSSPDAARRDRAVQALAEAGAAAAPRLAAVAANAETDAARLAALEALSRNSMAYAYSYVLWDALPEEDEDASTRRVVWDCLMRLGDSFLAVGEFGAASDHYCDLLESAVSPVERAKAIRGLGRSGRRRAADEVFAALADGDPLVRAAAFAAVAELRWGQASPHLERVLKTAESDLLVGLLDSLSRRGEPAADAMVAPFLDHGTASVRSAARRARARHAGFITEWWVLGPVPAAGASSSRNPNLAVGSFRPRERTTLRLDGKSLRWRRVVASGSNGIIDLAQEHDPSDTAVSYACAEVAANSVKRVRLSLSGAARACWLDGERLDGAEKRHSLEIDLQRGTRRIVVELVHREGASAFCLRATDASGAPVILAPPQGE